MPTDEHYLNLYLALRTRLNKFAMGHGLSRDNLLDMTAEDVMTWLENGGATGLARLSTLDKRIAALEQWSALDRRVTTLEVAAKPENAHAPRDAAKPQR